MRSGSFSLPVPIPDRARRRSSSRPGPGQADEYSSLLADSSGETTLQNSLVNPGDDDDKTPQESVAGEFWILLRGSLPVIVAYALQNSLQTASVLIVGRLSPEALATAAFAYMFAMATGWLIALGGTTAIDTLASAGFTGGKDPHGLGVILQRAFWVLTLFYVPVVVLWVCAEPVFLLLGQEAYLARDAARFLQALIPGGLGYIFFECMKKFLQAQGPSPIRSDNAHHVQRSCAPARTCY
jgi:MATE family multidrug resistance protein